MCGFEQFPLTLGALRLVFIKCQSWIGWPPKVRWDSVKTLYYRGPGSHLERVWNSLWFRTWEELDGIFLLGEGGPSRLVGVTVSAPDWSFKAKSYTFSKPCPSIKKKYLHKHPWYSKPTSLLNLYMCHYISKVQEQILNFYNCWVKFSYVLGWVSRDCILISRRWQFILIF